MAMRKLKKYKPTKFKAKESRCISSSPWLGHLRMVFCDSAVMGLWEKSKNSANDFLSY